MRDLNKFRRKLPEITLFSALAVLAAIALFPLVFTVLNSLMGGHEIISRYADFQTDGNADGLFFRTLHFVDFSLMPQAVTFEKYADLLTKSPLYLMMFWNSLKITAPVLVGNVIVSAMAAFAFEHLRFKAKEAVYFVYLIVMLMPLQVLLVPNFLVADWLNIRQNYLAIILPGIFSPFGVFLIRQHLKGFPSEYFDAAFVDGAGYLQFFIRIIIPCMKPTLAALTILTFVEYWNVVDQAVVFIHQTYRQPLSVYLSRMVSLDMGMVFATSALYMLPALLLFFAGTEQMAEGLRLSGIK